MSNKTYDVLKLCIQIAFPAVITCIGVIGQAVAWPYTEITMTILGAITACAGTILKGIHDTYMEDKIVLKSNIRSN